jgi:PIN domain nuclease of toxin-antitoxin system
LTLPVLLDSQIIYAVIQDATDQLPPKLRNFLRDGDLSATVSVTSLWELTIKWRTGKLGLLFNPDVLPRIIRSFGFTLLPITEMHVIAEIVPELEHRDPFDRLLLGICAVEGMRLLTVDKALVNHPLAWRA